MSNNRLKGTTAYLIGPMEYSQDRGEGWRKELSVFLREKMGIGVYDPCDKACDTGLEGEEELQKLFDLKESGRFDEVVRLMKDIVRVDLSMVDKSDFVIVFLDMDVYTCGSYVEIAHAAMERKPILVVCKQGKNKIPGFLWGLCGGHSTFFSDWKQLKDYIVRVAIADDFDDLNGRWKFFNYDKVY